jgi:hypothetical protein
LLAQRLVETRTNVTLLGVVKECDGPRARIIIVIRHHERSNTAKKKKKKKTNTIPHMFDWKNELIRKGRKKKTEFDISNQRIRDRFLQAADGAKCNNLLATKRMESPNYGVLVDPDQEGG